MKTTHTPHWWTHEIEAAWQRVREAVRRDWEQTRHDLDHFRHDLADARKQANAIRQDQSPEGNEPHAGFGGFADYEPGYRFGYGARARYGQRFRDWSPELVEQLHKDWKTMGGGQAGEWRQHQQAVRKGWEAAKETK